MNNQLDGYTISYLLKEIRKYIQNSRDKSHEDMDFIEGYLYGLMKLEEDFKKLYILTEKDPKKWSI